MIDSRILKNEERAMLSLRALYKNHGYLPFKMSKFEEYDLYVRNKEFLVSDSVITFNDTDGRLLALKPDVTLSIIKNGVDVPGCKQKVYYNENVYRVSGSTHLFKEILQSGVECIGDIDILDLYESVYLAAKSLSTISDRFVLDVSHMGILSAVLVNASTDETFKKSALAFIGDKNSHDLKKLCAEYGVKKDAEELLLSLIAAYGAPGKVLEDLSALRDIPATSVAYKELYDICKMLESSDVYANIRIDFSVVNNMSYYNGIVFKGFLDGICEGVLSGGQYDDLVKRMGRDSKAVGFALYLDLLESLGREDSNVDIDFLILYDDETNAEDVITVKTELISKGKSVLASKAIPDKLRFIEMLDMRKEASV